MLVVVWCLNGGAPVCLRAGARYSGERALIQDKQKEECVQVAGEGLGVGLERFLFSKQ